MDIINLGSFAEKVDLNKELINMEKEFLDIEAIYEESKIEMDKIVANHSVVFKKKKEIHSKLINIKREIALIDKQSKKKISDNKNGTIDFSCILDEVHLYQLERILWSYDTECFINIHSVVFAKIRFAITERELYVVVNKLNDIKTIKIANHLEVSRERVSQIYKSAIKKLKHPKALEGVTIIRD